MHHENLKKQKDKKIGPQQKLQKIDKMHLSNKARTARTQSNTMVNNSEVMSKNNLLNNSGAGSPIHSMDQNGKRYQQLMAQTFIPELAVLEKRIAKVNKIPD